jgi:hypothetical protein
MTNDGPVSNQTDEPSLSHVPSRRRDNRLIVVLCGQAAINAAASSQSLVEIAPPRVTATVALINAMLSSATAAYVASTRATSTTERG